MIVLYCAMCQFKIVRVNVMIRFKAVVVLLFAMFFLASCKNPGHAWHTFEKEMPNGKIVKTKCAEPKPDIVNNKGSVKGRIYITDPNSDQIVGGGGSFESESVLQRIRDEVDGERALNLIMFHTCMQIAQDPNITGSFKEVAREVKNLLITDSEKEKISHIHNLMKQGYRSYTFDVCSGPKYLGGSNCLGLPATGQTPTQASIRLDGLEKNVYVSEVRSEHHKGEIKDGNDKEYWLTLDKFIDVDDHIKIISGASADAKNWRREVTIYYKTAVRN